MSKKLQRIRRATRSRKHIHRLGMPRLTVHRTPRNIYAQLLVDDNGQSKVIASASTLDKELRASLSGDKTNKAKSVGAAIAERAVKQGYKQVAFDRSGFKYHGRVKALADAAREAGLEF